MKKKVLDSKCCRLLFVLTFISFSLFLFASLSIIRDSLWRDEAFSAVLISHSLPDLIKIMAGDFAPFLHPLVLWFTSRIFGFSEISLRSISFVSTIITVFYLRSFFKKKVYKNCATILFFSSYLTYYYAAEARYYSLFTLLVVAAFYYTLNFFKNKSSRNKILWVITSTLLLYTHNIGLFIYATYCLILLINYLRLNKKDLLALLKSRNKQNFWLKLFPKLKDLFIMLLPFVFFLPWFFILLGQVGSLKDNPFWLRFHPWDSLRDNIFYFYFWSKFIYVESIFDLSTWQVVVIFYLMFLTLLGIIAALKQKKFEFVLAGILPLVFVYVLSFKQPLFYIRYIMFAYPFIVVFIVLALKQFFDKKKKAVTVLMILFLIFNTHLYIKYYYNQGKPKYRLLGQYIRNSFDLNKFKLVNETEYTYFPCEYYLDNCLIAKKKEDIANVGKVLIAEETAVDLAEVAHYDKLVLISWDPNFYENHQEFKKHIFHQTRIDNFYIYGLYKLD